MKYEPDQTFLPFLDPSMPVPMPAPAARAKDPPTSHEAAAGAKQWAGDHHVKILEALQLGPASKTVLASRTGIDGVAVARRTGELVGSGQIVVISNDGVSLTGKRERVYALPWQSMRAAK